MSLINSESAFLLANFLDYKKLLAFCRKKIGNNASQIEDEELSRLKQQIQEIEQLTKSCNKLYKIDLEKSIRELIKALEVQLEDLQFLSKTEITKLDLVNSLKKPKIDTEGLQEDVDIDIQSLNRVPLKKGFFVKANFTVGELRKPMKYDFADFVENEDNL